MVRTRSLLQISKMIDSFSQSRPGNLVVLYGERGIGKTTILNYIEDSVTKHPRRGKVLPLRVIVFGGVRDDLSSLVESFLWGLHDSIKRSKQLPENIRARFTGIANSTPTLWRKDAPFLMATLLDQIENINQSFDGIVFLVDELDKIPRERAISLLEGSQGLLERLSSLNATFIATIAPPEHESFQAERNSFVNFQHGIMVEDWAPEELEQLLTSRLSYGNSRDVPSNFFTAKSLRLLITSAKGNPRRLLVLASGLFEWAANLQRKPIDETLIREFLLAEWPSALLTSEAVFELGQKGGAYRDEVLEIASTLAKKSGREFIEQEDIAEAVERTKSKGG